MCGKGSQTSTTVNTPPQNVLDQYDKVVGGANNVVNNNPNGLPVAGFNDYQNQALGNFGTYFGLNGQASGYGTDVGDEAHDLSRMNTGAAGIYQPYFNSATGAANSGLDLINTGANALASSSGNLGQAADYYKTAGAGVSFNPVSASDIAGYQNPYTKNVIDATSANIDKSNAIQQQGVISDAIKSGNAFGGDRMGVAQAELARNQDLAKNQTIAGLQDQGYSQALAEANNQQQLRTATGEYNSGAANAAGAGYAGLGSLNSQVAGQYGSLAGAYNSGANTYGSLGTQAQGNVLNSYYGANSALNTQLGAGGLLNSTALAGLQSNLGLLGAGTQYQTTQQQQLQAPYSQYGWLGQLSGFMNPGGGTSTTTGPAPFFSDKRMKEDITPVGKLKDGQTVYRYRYKGDPAFQIGLLAQDVEKKHPDAVSSHGGMLAVDYKAATDKAARGHFGLGGTVGEPQNNLFPGLDLSGASAGLPQGQKMARPTAPAQPQSSALGNAIENKALNFGMDKAGAGLDKGFGALKSGLGMGAGSAAGDLGGAGAAAAMDPLAAEIGAGTGFAAPAAAAAAAPVAAEAAGTAAAGAGASSMADILPFLFLKRGGRTPSVAPMAGNFGMMRARRAVGGRIGYDDGGAVDDLSPYGDLGGAVQAFSPAPTFTRPDIPSLATAAADAPAGSLGGPPPRPVTIAKVPSGLAPSRADAPMDIVPSSGDATFARMLHQESGSRQFDRDGNVITSPKGALGIAQIMPGTGPEAAKLAGMPWDENRLRTDQNYNAALGKAYFNQQLQTFGNPEQAAAAYNAGPGRVKDAMAMAASNGGSYLDYLPAETRDYVSKVTGGGGANKTAMAYADNAGPGNFGAARAINNVSPSGTLGDAPSASNDNSGPLGSLGSNVSDFLSQPGMGKALLAGLFGMLGSKSHTLAGAIGEGGLAGVNQFQTAQNLDRQNAIAQAQIGHLGVQDKIAAGGLDLKRQMLQRQMDAARAAAGALTDPSQNAPTSAPAPINPYSAPPATDGGTSTGASAPGAGVVTDRITGKPIPVNSDGAAANVAPASAAAATGPQLPPQNSDFWNNIDPQSNPAYLFAQADRFQAGARAAAQDPATMKVFLQQATALRQRAATIQQSGLLQTRSGGTVLAPGFAEAKAAATSAETTARVNAENAGKPAVTATGDEYIAPPGSQPAIPAPGKPSGTPPHIVIDPKTAGVTTSIPTAPAGGGYPLPNVPPGAKVTKLGEGAQELAKNDAGFTKDFLEKAPRTDQAIERMNAMAQAFKLVESGSTTEKLAGYAAIAKSYGYDGIAQKVLGGDPAAVQWIKKNSVNLVLDTLTAAQPRFAQSEFNKLAENGVPTPENLPQANHQMISEGLGMLQRNKAFMEDWDKARQQGWASPSAFWTEWSKANPLSDFQKSAQRQMGNFKGMDLPPVQDWAAGTIYVAPKNMPAAQAAVLAKRGIQPGQIFRFNGKDADQPIEPISPTQNYSAHLGR